MAIILLKRGLITDIEKLILNEGEPAIAYNEDKHSAQLYVGGADGTKILITADVTAQIEKSLETAKTYTDTTVTAKINDLIHGAPTTLDTLQEIADAIENNQSVVKALNDAIGSKVDKEEGKVLSDENYTSEEKEKLAGIDDGANNYTHPATHNAEIIVQDAARRFVTDAEKQTWNAKLDSNSQIDGGTF